ncbi:MAG: DUF1501 domain-containing protein [Cyanobacteria bacterium J06598_1]
MKRRQFLTRSALLGASALGSVGVHGWLWKGTAKAANTPRLIVVMLRGAADGLNIVAPYQESRYYIERPYIAIPKPGETDGLLDLDGQFGLHPALESLMPEWEAGNLAFVQATGSPHHTRSHFQAQDYLESGTPGTSSTSNGWLNRLLTALPEGGATQALTMNSGGSLPLIFKGPESVSVLNVNNAGNPRFTADQRGAQSAFDQLYTGSSTLSRVYQEGRQAQGMLMEELDEEEIQASRGAPNAERFANTTRSLARLMTGDTGTQVAFLEVGGWDMHVAAKGALPRQLEPLGNGLAALTKELGELYENTTIVVISEFGRTVGENGNGGTDHGHGNAMWLLGGGVRGRKVYGEWPGLGTANQYEGRDLAVTTDFRDVLMSLFAQQFDLGDRALAQVFPGHRQQTRLTLL